MHSIDFLQITPPVVGPSDNSLEIICVEYHGQLKYLIYVHYDFPPLQIFFTGELYAEIISIEWKRVV